MKDEKKTKDQLTDELSGVHQRIAELEREITDCRRAEDRLRESEQKYRNMVELAADSMITVNLEGVITYSNTAFFKKTGCAPEEVIDKHFSKLPIFRAKDISRYYEIFESLIRGKMPESQEFAWLDKDGTAHVSEVRLSCARERGKIVGVHAVTRDITERKQQEEKERQYASGLSFLSRTAMEFVQFPLSANIYQFIGKRLRELVGDSSVAVNSFSPETRCLHVRALLGKRKDIESITMNLGRNIFQICFPVNDEAWKGLTSGRLVKVPGGLHVLSFGKIPKRMCQRFEKLFNFGDIYTMGFTRKGELFGNTVIITRKGRGLGRFDLIEAFIGQASVALQRKRVEEELKKYRSHLEKLVGERTARLKAANKRLQREIVERKKAEAALRTSESKLQQQKFALEKKNIALREIIAQIEVEKRKIREDIHTNASLVLGPILEKLKMENANSRHIELLQHHLKELTSSFGSRITERRLKLTPREIEVCNFIKGGLTSKDISSLLNISYQTVEKHRKNIRHKIGISKRNMNLTSFLRHL